MPAQIGASLSGPQGRNRTGRHPEELIRAREAASRRVAFIAGLALVVSAVMLPIYAVESGASLTIPKVLPAVAGGLPVNRSLAAAFQRHRETDPTFTGSLHRGAATAVSAQRPMLTPGANAADEKAGSRDYLVKGVSRGVALVEGPDGLHEVIPGSTLPGAGRVVSIERAGNKWVVVTTETIIGEGQS